MSLVYIFTFSKVGTEQITRLMGVNVAVKPGAHVGPARVGANELVLFASDMGPKIARTLANSVLNNANPTKDRTVANTMPDAVLIGGLCGGLTVNLQQNRIVTYKECRPADGSGTPDPCSRAHTKTSAQGVGTPRLRAQVDHRLLRTERC